ncbi:hypothetical protein ACQ4PT_014216 [Festuca glaucescens]
MPVNTFGANTFTVEHMVLEQLPTPGDMSVDPRSNSRPSPTPQAGKDDSALEHQFHTLQIVLDTSPATEPDEELHFLATEEPDLFNEAKSDTRRRRAMEEEMEAIEENSTWRLTTLPPYHCAIGLKWVHKVKKDVHGPLRDRSEVGAQGKENLVLRLDKALYGLKQVPRAWNTACLVKLGFAQCKPEHDMHARGTTTTRLLVVVYVDDLVIIGANSSNIDNFKLEMKSLFQMSDLRLLSYYHGIEVRQGLGRIDISQSAYAQKLLEKAGMAGSNPCHVPTEPRFKLSKCNTGPASDAEYWSTVRSLWYLVHTRPDLTFAVGFVSRFMEAPMEDHLAAVKRILCYIVGSTRLGCRYGRGLGAASRNTWLPPQQLAKGSGWLGCWPSSATAKLRTDAQGRQQVIYRARQESHVP